ncbi:hypothetical protein [Siminovitchia acidinfaciens]|uniref:hypothetical protein n=1 Tax=Siminovitchia acidinfaciens TaxID=2321395 RepID=UPI002E25B733
MKGVLFPVFRFKQKMFHKQYLHKLPLSYNRSDQKQAHKLLEISSQIIKIIFLFL